MKYFIYLVYRGERFLMVESDSATAITAEERRLRAKYPLAMVELSHRHLINMGKGPAHLDAIYPRES